MKFSKLFLIFLLVTCYQLFSTMILSTAIAGSEDLLVTKITRIMPSDYRADSIYHGTRDWAIWNTDNTRMMLYESPSATHPVSKKTGRGLVWGFVTDFKSWTNTADYESKIHPLPNTIQSHRTDPTAVWWSIFPNEGNIVYVALDTGWLVKVNVDTNAIINIVYFQPVGVNISDAKIYGWTKDNTLVMSYGYENWTYGGAEIDVQTPAIIKQLSNRPNDCSVEYQRWPDYSHGHSGKSPSGRLLAKDYGYANKEGVYTVDSACNYTADLTYENNDSSIYPWYGVHISWKASENWFLMNTGESVNVNGLPQQPTLADYKLYQVYFNGITYNYRELLSHKSPLSWNNGVNSVNNYNSHILATLRKDGKQALFIGTDGKYSYEDCVNKATIACTNGWVSTTWGFEGYFLVDLASSSGSETCTSFTYSPWGECQPNNTKIRTVTSSSPSGCTGGDPALVQSCTYDTGTPAQSMLKTTSSPIIDGNLGEYVSANPISFSPSTGGNIVTVRTLWDSEALYFGIDVTDTQLNASVTTRDGSVWSEDSIEWFIDTYNDGGGSLNPNTAYMRPDDYQGIVNIINTKYDSQGTASGTPSSTWNGTWQSAVKLNGTLNNNSDTDSGYTIEIKIPWISIGYSSAPSADSLTGMSFAVNDKDSSGIYSKMWLSNDGSNQNASNWQNVMLSGTLVAVDSIPPGHPLELMIQ